MNITHLIKASIVTCAMALGSTALAAPIEDTTLIELPTFFGDFEHAAVAADHPIASAAGAQMLELGGNAVDAAVAASFTLSVVRPYSCGIGGGGFMVIYLPDDPTHGTVKTAINYREMSPYDATPYQRGYSIKNGRFGVAIPGTVHGLLHALENYGTLDRATVLGPAIRAAEIGFVVDAHYMGAAQGLIEKYTNNPGLRDSHMSLPWEKFALWGKVKEGDRIQNPEHADALRLIIEHGTSAMTTGEIGQAIVEALDYKGMTLTTKDLASYKVQELDPIETTIYGKQLLGMPPPSSGGVTMFQALEIMEHKGYDFNDDSIKNSRIHIMVEALKHAFADRSRYLADPDFSPVPIDAMLSDDNIKRMASQITSTTKDPSFYGTHNALPEDAGTSHVSVVDPWGGAVAMTETINHEFGSRVGVERFGFILNNEMDDFTHPNAANGSTGNGFGLVQSDRNIPEIGKRPLSSMSPTIVLDEEGQVLAVAGASGGPKIITGTMQVLLNVFSGLGAGESVARERLHHQWKPNMIRFEEGYSVYIRNVIGNKYGHELDSKHTVVGNVQLIIRDPDGSGWEAASDPRKGGRPSGLD